MLDTSGDGEISANEFRDFDRDFLLARLSSLLDVSGATTVATADQVARAGAAAEEFLQQVLDEASYQFSMISKAAAIEHQRAGDTASWLAQILLDVNGDRVL